MIEDNIIRFLNGIAFMFFAYMSYRILRNKCRTRIQAILGYTLLFWALLVAKDLGINYLKDVSAHTDNILFFIDSWAVAACSFYLLELTSPGWMNLKRMAAQLSPFVIMTVLYIFTTWQILFYIYILFIVLYSGIIVLVVSLAARRYSKYIRNNYSYSENIDIAWIKKATFILAICLTAWIFTGIYISIWGDCVYCVLSILLWFIIFYYSEYQISIPIPNNQKENQLAIELKKENNGRKSTASGSCKPTLFFRNDLEKVMYKQKLYLNPKLTITEVANAIGTNRTYLSAYFNNELNTTFYDFINNQRIEKVSKALLENSPFDMTIEEIAERSGFNSAITFRRAFQKNTGTTPLKYRKSKHCSNSF